MKRSKCLFPPRGITGGVFVSAPSRIRALGPVRPSTTRFLQTANLDSHFRHDVGAKPCPEFFFLRSKEMERHPCEFLLGGLS